MQIRVPTSTCTLCASVCTSPVLEAVTGRVAQSLVFRSCIVFLVQGQCAGEQPCDITLASSLEVIGSDPYLWIDNINFTAAPQFEGESLLYVRSQSANLWVTNTAFKGNETAEVVPNGVTLTSGGAFFGGALEHRIDVLR